MISGFFLPIALRRLSASFREKPEIHGREHDLLLIDEAAEVPRGSIRLVRVGDVLAVLAVDEHVDHPRLQRARPVERETAITSSKQSGLSRARSLRMPSDSSWNTPSVSPAMRSSKTAVVKRKLVHHRRLEAAAPDVLQALVDDRERAKPQVVHLEEAELLELGGGELGRDVVPVPAEGYEVHRGARRDHDARGVGGAGARCPRGGWSTGRAPSTRVPGPCTPEGPGRRRSPWRGAERRGPRGSLRDLVDLRERKVEGLAHVTHHGARRHGPEGDDLGDAVAAVLARVLDDPLAALLAEVDVDVRHRHAARVQEALEEQVVLQRAQPRDVEQVRDDRAGRRTPARPHGDAAVAGPLEEVPDDQEVRDEAEVPDDLLLVLGRSRAFELSTP